MSTEKSLAATIASFLGARARVASDLGLLRFVVMGGALLVEFGEALYEVSILVERRR